MNARNNQGNLVGGEGCRIYRHSCGESAACAWHGIGSWLEFGDIYGAVMLYAEIGVSSVYAIIQQHRNGGIISDAQGLSNGTSSALDVTRSSRWNINTYFRQ